MRLRMSLPGPFSVSVGGRGRRQKDPNPAELARAYGRAWQEIKETVRPGGPETRKSKAHRRGVAKEVRAAVEEYKRTGAL